VLTENDIKFWGERFIDALKNPGRSKPARDEDAASIVPSPAAAWSTAASTLPRA